MISFRYVYVFFFWIKDRIDTCLLSVTTDREPPIDYLPPVVYQLLFGKKILSLEQRFDFKKIECIR